MRRLAIRRSLWILVAVWLPVLGAAAQTDPDCDPGSASVIARLDTSVRDAVSARKPDTPNAPTRLFVSGTPEEVGRAIGERYADDIAQLAPLFRRLARAHTGRSDAQLDASVAALVATLSPDARAEIVGVAGGSGVPLADVQLLNVFYSLTVDEMACRQLAAWGPSTVGGGLIHARNLDWPDYPGHPMQKKQVILNVKPADGIEHVLLTWPGVTNALTGTNKEGITLAFNRLYGSAPEQMREPVFFTLRRILSQAHTLDEAVAMLRAARPMGNGAVMISDAKIPKAVVIEMMNGEIAVREADQPGLISAANHPTAEAGLKTAVSQQRSAFEPVSRVAQTLGKELAPEQAQAVMSHADVLLRINITSVVFLPGDNRMLLSAGTVPAALGHYQEYTLFP